MIKIPPKKILITAGPTKEAIDPVRFISNASSGKMGSVLAAAAHRAGFDVTVITSLTDLKVAVGVKTIYAASAKQMFEAVKANFDRCDCLIMAAAVSDYTPRKISKLKIKKGSDELTITLKPTRDILKWAGRHKMTGQFLVGFALEDRDLKKRAEQKLLDKNLDMIIANAPTAIGADESELFIKLRDSQWLSLPKAKKITAARRIISLISRYLTQTDRRSV